MALFANGGVDADVEIAVYSASPDDEVISIMFGKEHVTLEFYEVESLERLRDLAAEGARRLRMVIEANARPRGADREAEDVAPATDRPVALVGGVL